MWRLLRSGSSLPRVADRPIFVSVSTLRTADLFAQQRVRMSLLPITQTWDRDETSKDGGQRLFASSSQSKAAEEQTRTKMSKPRKVRQKKRSTSYDEWAYSELFSCYVRAKDVDHAKKTLRSMEKGGFTVRLDLWNRLAELWISLNDFPRAWDVLERIKQSGQQPNARTFQILLDGCARDRESLNKYMRNIISEMERARVKPQQLLAHQQQRKRFRPESPTMNRKNMDPKVFIKITPERMNASEEELMLEEGLEPFPKTLYQRQVDLELQCLDEAKDEYFEVIRNVTDIGKAADLKPAHRLLLKWYMPLLIELNRLKDIYTSGKFELEEYPGLDQYGPHLMSLPSDKQAICIIYTVLGCLLRQPQGVTTTSIAFDVANSLQDELNFTTKAEREKEIKRRRVAFQRANASSTEGRHSMGFNGESISDVAMAETEEWSKKSKITFGGAVLDMLLKSAEIDERASTSLYQYKNRKDVHALDKQYYDDLIEPLPQPQPAFEHWMQSKDGRIWGMIRLNEHVIDVVDAQHILRQSIGRAMLPMIVPPQPWTDPRNGGYLRTSISVMRTKGSQKQGQLLREYDLSEIYHGLTQLGAVKWRINNGVLRVLKEVWERGGGIGEVPSRRNFTLPSIPHGDNAEEKKRFNEKVKKLKQKNAELHSLRCDLLLKMGVAERFQNEEAIFFPHNLDFRGRCYPIPPHLNHMGSDLCRGLLQFAEKKPLGREGLRWIKIHLSNLFGNNKIPYDQRVEFTEEHMSEVIDSATNPLDGRRWWLEAEDPWQALAACMDLHAAYLLEDPTTHFSNLPVHMDGSCNGLQHYAALGGDVDGACSVNLVPMNKPQDVYTEVLNIVNEIIENDAENGSPIAQRVRGTVRRKTIKQTVMTTVYGVTFVGARQQIFNQLKDQAGDETLEINDTKMYEESIYITKRTLQAVERMFTNARKIMTWLGELARISAMHKRPAQWTTPLGLPVLQPYRRLGKHVVKTAVQNITLVEQNDRLPVSINKQQSAFPPNYVHSLDATHMFMTAKRCEEIENITFAAVHDSYWTHARDVDKMNRQLREAFVDLHERPLLHDLKAEFEEALPECEFPPVPPRGSLDIESVLESQYFFQ